MRMEISPTCVEVHPAVAWYSTLLRGPHILLIPARRDPHLPLSMQPGIFRSPFRHLIVSSVPQQLALHVYGHRQI